VNDLISVELDREELKAAMRFDCQTFFAFYIGADLTLDIPEVHEEIWNELLGYLDRVNQPGYLVGHLQKLFEDAGHRFGERHRAFARPVGG